MAWNEISLDDLDEQIKELQILNEKTVKAKETTKDDSNKSVDSRASVKSARNEDEDDEDWADPSDVQADDENEGDDENEQEDEEGSVDEDHDAPRNRGSKSDGKLDRGQSDETETIRRALAEVQRERDAALAQLAESEQAKSNLRKSTLESQRDSVAGEIKTLKAQVNQAKESGDREAETDLMLEIQKKQLRELAIESALEDIDKEVQKKPQAKAAPETKDTQNQQVMPAEAQNFVKRNAWIATAPEAVRMTVVTQSQMLIDQGKDPARPEFYDALERRLNAALEGSGYTVQGRTNKQAKAEPKAKSKGSPIPPKEQTTKVYRDANGNTRVVATKADKDMAERLGMDLKVYMQNKLNMEKATGGVAANWAPIKVG